MSNRIGIRRAGLGGLAGALLGMAVLLPVVPPAQAQPAYPGAPTSIHQPGYGQSWSTRSGPAVIVVPPSGTGGIYVAPQVGTSQGYGAQGYGPQGYAGYGQGYGAQGYGGHPQYGGPGYGMQPLVPGQQYQNRPPSLPRGPNVVPGWGGLPPSQNPPPVIVVPPRR